MERLVVFLVAYLLGSIPFAYFAGLTKHIDVRQGGSGNVGTTNAFRLLGVKLGIAVLVGDTLKGFLAATLGYWAYGPWGGVGAGLLAMIGHSWNPFFGFRPSGKGVASGLGIIAALMPAITFLAVGFFAGAVAITRYVSIGSILGALTVCISVFLFPEPLAYQIFGVVAGGLVIVRHRANIQRLLNGQEHKFSIKK